MVGLGGANAHFTTNYWGEREYPQEFYDKFRNLVLTYYGCMPKPQRDYDRPKVVLIQRRKSRNDNVGSRVFKEIDDLNYFLYNLDADGKIEYSSYVYFERRPWIDQICMIAASSILIGMYRAICVYVFVVLLYKFRA